VACKKGETYCLEFLLSISALPYILIQVDTSPFRSTQVRFLCPVSFSNSCYKLWHPYFSFTVQQRYETTKRAVSVVDTPAELKLRGTTRTAATVRAASSKIAVLAHSDRSPALSLVQ